MIKSTGGRLGKSVAEGEVSVPDSYALYQNYPNPFNPETEIRFVLPDPSHVSLEIYHISGKRIATLRNSKENAGYHSMPWDGKDELGRSVAGGIYICRIQAGSFEKTIKMLLLK